MFLAYFKGLAALYVNRLSRSTTNLSQSSHCSGRVLNCSCRVDGAKELSHLGPLKAYELCSEVCKCFLRVLLNDAVNCYVYKASVIR